MFQSPGLGGQTGKQTIEGQPQVTLDPGSAVWTRLRGFLCPGTCLCGNPMWMKQVLDLEILVWPCLTQAPMVDAAPWIGPGQALPHTPCRWTRDQRSLHRDQARKSNQNMNLTHPLIQLFHFWKFTLQVSPHRCKMACGEGRAPQLCLSWRNIGKDLDARP